MIKKAILLRIIIFAAALNLAAAPVISSLFGLKIPARPEARVSDWAGIISQGARESLENKLAAFEEKTGNQIAIATFPSLEGESLEDFSIHLAEQWKIGQKGKDNGVIILVFRDDHRMRIEVGYGLEGVLPDAIASEIIRRIMAPRFREGDFDGGITGAVDAIIQVISGENPSQLAEEDTGSGRMNVYKLNMNTIKTVVGIIFALFGLFFIIDIFRYSGYSAANRNYKHRYGFIEWLIIFGITLAILKIIFQMIAFSTMRGYGGGRGGFGGGSGGFSGGGGSFGGGGSSGSW